MQLKYDDGISMSIFVFLNIKSTFFRLMYDSMAMDEYGTGY